MTIIDLFSDIVKGDAAPFCTLTTEWAARNRPTPELPAPALPAVWQVVPIHPNGRAVIPRGIERSIVLMKLIGFKRNDFSTKEGTTITGYSLYLAYPATGPEAG